MKKILVLAMCLTVALSFTGCKEKTTEEKMQDTATQMKKDAEKAGKDMEKDAEKVKKDAAKKLDKLTE
jgi:ABC-type transporter MlaC component